MARRKAAIFSCTSAAGQDISRSRARIGAMTMKRQDSASGNAVFRHLFQGVRPGQRVAAYLHISLLE